MGLKHYYDMDDAPLSDLLRQANIKTENQLMYFSDSSSQYCTDTDIITGSYIIFYQGVVEDHRSLGGSIISRLDNGAFVGLI